mgnify:CR=1 FL=1
MDTDEANNEAQSGPATEEPAAAADGDDASQLLKGKRKRLTKACDDEASDEDKSEDAKVQPAKRAKTSSGTRSARKKHTVHGTYRAMFVFLRMRHEMIECDEGLHV